MFEAAQRGAFDGRRLRIERVDLHDPAVTVEFVGVFGQVEALVVWVPVDLFAGHHRAVAFLRRVEFLLGVAAAEAVGEVFFTGQIGAPRRLAIGTVLEGAENVLALGIGAGFQQGNVVGEQFASRGQAEPSGEDLDDLARDEAERLHVTRDRNQWTKGFRDGFARGFERFCKQAFFDVTSLHLVSLIAECKFSA